MTFTQKIALYFLSEAHFSSDGFAHDIPMLALTSYCTRHSHTQHTKRTHNIHRRPSSLPTHHSPHVNTNLQCIHTQHPSFARAPQAAVVRRNAALAKPTRPRCQRTGSAAPRRGRTSNRARTCRSRTTCLEFVTTIADLAPPGSLKHCVNTACTLREE